MSAKFEKAEALILAGGAGVRMGDLTKDKQKCLLPIDGMPILGHVLEALAKAIGPADVTLSVSHRANDVHDYVQRNTPKGIEVNFLPDNGHSQTAKLYRSTKGTIHGTFVATSGDIVVDPNVYTKAYDLALQDGVFASVALATKIDETDTHAVGKMRDGRVTELLSPPPLPAELDDDHLRDMSVCGITQAFHAYADRYPNLTAVPRLLQQAITDGLHVASNFYDSNWVHVAYPDDLLKSMQHTTWPPVPRQRRPEVPLRQDF